MKKTHTQSRSIISVLLILIMLVITVKANAQNASGAGTQTTNLVMADAIELTFINGAGGTQTANMTTVNEMVNGVELDDQDMRVRSNKPFKVTVAPATTNFVYTGAATSNNIIPAGTGFKIKVSNNNTGGNSVGGWTALAGVLIPTTILDNGDAGGNQTFTIKYKTLGGAVMAPGTYTLNIVYTATQL